MTQIDKIKAEIERLKHYGTIPYDRDVFEGVCLIESFINSLPDEQPNEDLEKAANIYANKQGLELKPFASKFFKSGAQWQKEQMMKSATNGFMDCDDSNEWIEITDRFVVTPATAGKKVKVIIMEDEQ